MGYTRPQFVEKQSVGRKSKAINEKKISRSFTVSPELLTEIYDILEKENLKLSPIIEELLEDWVAEKNK